MAETNGLLNRRTGKSGTEGSNPSVSAIISITFITLGLAAKPALVPVALFLCWTASHCDESAPNLLPKIQPEQPHRFGTLPLACSAQTSERFRRRGIASVLRPESPKKERLAPKRPAFLQLDLAIRAQSRCRQARCAGSSCHCADSSYPSVSAPRKRCCRK